ncbi:hypothetical protein DIX60_00685 [Streptococcus iniae]|nr:hypothetical protein BKX95_12035 [Streptococcus iniae]RLV28514.1 hypothetical protein DIX60_00685 [Streptococcus iniae]
MPVALKPATTGQFSINHFTEVPLIKQWHKQDKSSKREFVTAATRTVIEQTHSYPLKQDKPRAFQAHIQPIKQCQFTASPLLLEFFLQIFPQILIKT